MDDDTTSIKDGIKATSKLLEIIQETLAPFNLKRQANVVSEIPKILDSSLPQGVEIDNYEVVDGKINMTASRVITRRFKEEYRKQINIDAISEVAVKELQNIPDSEVADEPINTQWWYNYWDRASNIEEEEAKAIWGKILSREVIKPGSFSLKTLEILGSMQKQDAELFRKIKERIIFTGSDSVPAIIFRYEDKDLSYMELTDLAELGLIYSDLSNLIYKIEPHPDLPFLGFEYSGQAAIFKHSENKRFEIKIYKPTRAALEISKIMDNSFNQNYWGSFVKEIRLRYPDTLTGKASYHKSGTLKGISTKTQNPV